MSMGEFDIIRQYFSDISVPRSDVLLGAGDDCALLLPPPGMSLAVSTDTLVAGRHFFPDVDPFELGHKSLAVNLSDLAAMGADPCWVSLALTLPPDEFDAGWLHAFSAGFSALCRQYHLQLVGGDTTAGPLSITVTIHGTVAPDKALRRSGAREDDLIFVSGQLGNAALALKQRLSGLGISPELQNALEHPQPRIELGRLLAGLASSAIDLSDGLMADLGHVCAASSCAAVLQLDLVPVADEVKIYLEQTSDWAVALAGGDDYELCFTISPDRLVELSALADQLELPLTRIGVIEAGQGVRCLDRAGQTIMIKKTGYEHFHE